MYNKLYIFLNKSDIIHNLQLELRQQYCNIVNISCLKGELSGLRQFRATESPLKMMKNTFYFTSKGLFVLKVFQFLS